MKKVKKKTPSKKQETTMYLGRKKKFEDNNKDPVLTIKQDNIKKTLMKKVRKI